LTYFISFINFCQRADIGVYFHVPGNCQILKGILTARSISRISSGTKTRFFLSCFDFFDFAVYLIYAVFEPLVRAPGIGAESPQELHGQFRGLVAESPAPARSAGEAPICL
jgi:hypothetical protein